MCIRDRSWTDQGVDSYSVRQTNGADTIFVATVIGETTFDLPGAADTYTVRYRDGGIIDTTCAGNPAPPLECTVTGDTLSWTDQRANRYEIRRIVTGSNTFLVSVFDELSLDISSSPANFYQVRAHTNIGTDSVFCEGNPPPAFECTVANGLVSWTDQNVVNYNVRQSVDGIESFLGSTPDLSFAVSGSADTYTIRYRAGADLVEVSCDGQPRPELTCTFALSLIHI